MKKEYMKPTMRVEKMQYQSIICTRGRVKSVQSSFDDPDDEFIFGDGGTEQGR